VRDDAPYCTAATAAAGAATAATAAGDSGARSAGRASAAEPQERVEQTREGGRRELAPARREQAAHGGRHRTNDAAAGGGRAGAAKLCGPLVVTREPVGGGALGEVSGGSRARRGLSFIIRGLLLCELLELVAAAEVKLVDIEVAVDGRNKVCAISLPHAVALPAAIAVSAEEPAKPASSSAAAATAAAAASAASVRPAARRPGRIGALVPAPRGGGNAGGIACPYEAERAVGGGR